MALRNKVKLQTAEIQRAGKFFNKEKMRMIRRPISIKRSWLINVFIWVYLNPLLILKVILDKSLRALV
jgi:hypothetical protein